MKARAHLEEAGDAPAHDGLAARGSRDPRKHLEERGLARAVTADDPEDLTPGDLQIDVSECPDVLVRAFRRRACKGPLNPAPYVSHQPAGAGDAEPVLLGKPAGLDRVGHSKLSF